MRLDDAFVDIAREAEIVSIDDKSQTHIEPPMNADKRG